MNILEQLKNETLNCELSRRTLLGEEKKYIFNWNNPLKLEELNEFEKNTGYMVPKEYIDFLMLSNGAEIYKSVDEYEDDGYKLLSIQEIVKETQELINIGYEIPKGWFCFMKCLYSDDVLLFDLNCKNNNIIDGDIAYPIDEWTKLKMDFNLFIIRLYQCDGSDYWRWFI